ncbi:MAG: TerB family tellurite resistance protein [Candidatus Cloacimonetes bacterium]|nr:TerB family tellurite resistance protein [Candidatus Cloacimonadota bacterium]
MSRWSPQLGRIIKLAGENRSGSHILDSFFISRAYTPQNDQEQKEFDEFSLVTSSMALMIHIAKADLIMHPEERNRIIEDLTFQLEQRPYEYEHLSDKFGKTDKEIISNMYTQLLDDYEKQKLDLDEMIRVINMIYKNNPQKRIYLLRLCYFCALSDANFTASEDKVIKEVAQKLRIPIREVKRVETEAREELGQRR